jgi:hypothetical protein
MSLKYEMTDFSYQVGFGTITSLLLFSNAVEGLRLGVLIYVLKFLWRLTKILYDKYGDWMGT